LQCTISEERNYLQILEVLKKMMVL